MSYYMGDWGYGHPRGDPFWSGLFRAATGILGLGGGRTKTVFMGPQQEMLQPQGGTMATNALGRMQRFAGRHPALAAGGAAMAAAAGLGGAYGMGRLGKRGPVMSPMAGGAVPKGYHVNKHGAVVKNRHMRVTNPRALHRALRRAHGFAKLAMHSIHLTYPKKRGRFGGFKRRRAKKA